MPPLLQKFCYVEGGGLGAFEGIPLHSTWYCQKSGSQTPVVLCE